MTSIAIDAPHDIKDLSLADEGRRRTDWAERSMPGFYQRAGGATMMKRVAETHEVIGPLIPAVQSFACYCRRGEWIPRDGLRDYTRIHFRLANRIVRGEFSDHCFPV